MTKSYLYPLYALMTWMILGGVFCIPLFSEEIPTVKIGLIYPLTGPMSSFGEDMARAVPLLEKKFNSEQSRYKFTLILEDGKFGQTNAAITAAKKLVEIDGVHFLVVGSSGEILQIASFVESKQILSVAGFSSHPAVRSAGDYIFRTYIDAGRGVQIAAQDMLKKGFNRVGIISEESSFTSAIRDALTESLGDNLVFSEDYALGDADLKTLVAKIRNQNLQALYLNTTTPANFVTLFKQLKESKVEAKLYTYYVPTLKDVQDNLGSSLDGTVYLDFPDTKGVSEDFQTFQKQFESINGNPARAPFNFRTNYNAIKVIFDSIMEVGPDSTKVKNYLYNYSRPSATGLLKFDTNGDALDLNLALKTYKFKT